MGLFIPEEDERFQGRPAGFPRYKQLLSDRFGRWWRVNFLTLLGFLPLAGGIFYGVGTSSLVVLLPCSLLGGMIAGPFLAGMYDAILRGLRDDPTPCGTPTAAPGGRTGGAACCPGRCWG